MNESSNKIVMPDVGIENKYVNERWYAENILTARHDQFGERFQTMPVPMTNVEWQYVQDSLRAFGCIELADRLKNRRDEMEDTRNILTGHATACRDACDQRKVCSVSVAYRPILFVNFSGHGSFGPDGDLSAMKTLFQNTTRWGALRGCGHIAEGVIANSRIYCG